ncbi:hypothetical protein P3L10_015810 [Capsicum annuum]
MVILPKARYEWMHMRFQDYKSVHEYNSAMFRISSQLKLCREKVNDDDMMEKTLSTFHASNVLLQQQYREKGFKNYTELSSHLLVAEQNNDLLMKNHENRPTRSAPFPEMNDVHAHHVRCRPWKWSWTWSWSNHLVDLYQASLKKKERNSEANFFSENNVDIACLDVADFFEHPEGKIDR